jgi:hypothetical protein
MARSLEQERVAVGLALRHRAGRDQAAGARHVLDHDALRQLPGQAVGEETRHQVDAAARRRGDEQPDRTVGPRGLRRCIPAGNQQ